MWSYYLGIITRVVPPHRDKDTLTDLHDIIDSEWASPRLRQHARDVLNTHDQPYPKNPGFVYVLKGDRYYKIGRTIQLSKRLSQISPLLPFEVSMVGIIPAYDHHAAEAELHRMYADKRTNGEWFLLNDKDILGIGSIPGSIFNASHIDFVFANDWGMRLYEFTETLFARGLWTHKMKGLLGG